MILGKLIWNTETFLLLTLFVGAAVFFTICSWRFGKAIEGDIYELTESPLENLPDEIALEIVHEKPQQPSATHTESSSPPATSPEPPVASYSRPGGKGVYLPE